MQDAVGNPGYMIGGIANIHPFGNCVVIQQLRNAAFLRYPVFKGEADKFFCLLMPGAQVVTAGYPDMVIIESKQYTNDIFRKALRCSKLAVIFSGRGHRTIPHYGGC